MQSTKLPWSTLQQTGQTVGQPAGTTAAGAAGTPDKAHWIHWIPATVLQDAVTYTHKGARRAWGRVIIILLAVIALGVLTAGRYLTSEDLISTRIIVRDTRTETFDEFSPVKGMCPCKVQNIQWGLFLDFKPAIKAMIYNNSAAFNVALCNQILVNRTANPPTQEQFYQETSDYVMEQSEKQTEQVLAGNFTAASAIPLLTNATNQVLNDYVLYGVRQMCTDMLLTFQQDLDTRNNLAQLYGSVLKTREDIASSWSAFASDSSRRQLKAWQTAYLAANSINYGIDRFFNQSCSLRATGSLVSCLALRDIPAIRNLVNMTSAPAAFMQTSFAAEDVSNRLSSAVRGGAGGDLVVSSSQAPHLLVRQFMIDATEVNYTAYQAKCAPSYCDFAQTKTAFNWVSEFLSTVGGLWTIVIGVATLSWGVIGMLGLVGSEDSAFYAWH